MKALLACILWACLVAAAAAQTYPARPVRFIVPFAPGGGTDLLARTLAQRLSESFGQPVVVDNRGGAGGVIGAELAARAPADGYTIVLGSPGPLTINPNLQRVSYDTLRDFFPITLATISPFILVLHPSVAATTVKELVALARPRPDGLIYGSGGNGSVAHFSGEQFRALTGVSLVHVPYKGAGPAVTDLIGGRLQFMFENLPTVLPHIRSGRLKALAVGTKTRSAQLPEYPTMIEAGVPGFEASTAFGVLSPAKTPASVVDHLNREIVKILHNPEIRERLLAQGLEPVGGTTQQYAAHLKDELAKYGRIVKAAGIKLD